MLSEMDLKMLFYGVTIAGACRVLAGFSADQSFVLAAAFVIVYSAAVEKAASVELRPFSVLIDPDWYVLLKDYGVVDDEKWNVLQERLGQQNPRDYNVLRHGISFTVLQYKLIYSN